MRFLLLLFISTSMLFLGGCTKDDLCDAGKIVSGVVASQIAVQLDCKNVDAVRADIEKKLEDIKVCEKADSTGAIGDVVCKPVIDAVTAGLMTKVPATWECSGGQFTEEVKSKLIASCVKLL